MEMIKNFEELTAEDFETVKMNYTEVRNINVDITENIVINNTEYFYIKPTENKAYMNVEIKLYQLDKEAKITIIKAIFRNLKVETAEILRDHQHILNYILKKSVILPSKGKYIHALYHNNHNNSVYKLEFFAEKRDDKIILHDLSSGKYKQLPFSNLIEPEHREILEKWKTYSDR